MEVTISLEEYRKDPDARCWDLPQWGHLISAGVMPLFLGIHGKLVPIGTAFSIGQTGVGFLVTAAHNAREAFKHERSLRDLISARTLPDAVTLNDVSFWLLHQAPRDDGLKLTFWPLEVFDGAPPTDLMVGFPKFDSTLPTLKFPISFDPPTRGEKVWSIGYHDFVYPDGGIDIEAVQAGRFDWQHDYGHSLSVVEGFVEQIFAQRFAAGYVDGPCFTFDAEIFHGQSGGPVMTLDGRIVGVNSAGATRYFGRPTSIASLLYPLALTSIRAPIQFAPNIKMTFSQRLIDWIMAGAIKTDGSEERLTFRSTQDGTSIGVVFKNAKAEHVYDNFPAFQDGRPAARAEGEYYRVRKIDG